MSITNSLYIGISGLMAHGDAISVVGDNIANASTVGFKRNRASFSDMLGGEITSQWHGRVDAVELTADGPRLRMGGVLLAPGDVRTIGLNDTSQNLTGTGVKQ